jgi:hypothetical protein
VTSRAAEGVRLLVVVGALLAAATVISVTPAVAGTPCWKKLMNDWYDGRIDHVYAVPCYHQAIVRLRDDLKVYTTATDDIDRALRRAISPRSRSVEQATTTAPKPAQSAAGGPTGPRPTPSATDSSSGGGSTSLPLPLLLLGGLAVLLLAAGAAGLILRRFRAREGG